MTPPQALIGVLLFVGGYYCALLPGLLGIPVGVVVIIYCGYWFSRANETNR